MLSYILCEDAHLQHMEKIKKITEQLENIGSLNAEGHGSVYKGRRIGEIFTAVKMLPAQVQTESTTDKNFVYFQHEITRLKKVNQHPNPHVTRFLNSGISGAGKLPFIEMDFIEGPNLEELQHPPHDAVFTVTEVLKIAEHLSDALAHWHLAGAKHGNVKSRNVKFNVHTGDYVLVNFGWSGSHDSGSSLNNPVAAESLAPEQEKGLTLFQTDVYHFGVILFKLLAGSVVISKEEKYSNNAGIISYLQTPPLEFLALRKKNIPSSWPDDKQQQENNLPEWLILTLYKCLEKDLENRFDNGMELHRHIADHLLISKLKENGGRLGNAGQESQLSVTEREAWKLSIEKEKHFYRILHGQWKELNESVSLKDKELQELREKLRSYSKQGGLHRLAGNKRALNIFLSVAVFSGVISAYLLFSHKADNKPAPKISSVTTKPDTTISQHSQLREHKDIIPKPVEEPLKKDTLLSVPPATVPTIKEPVSTSEQKPIPETKDPVVVKERSPEVSLPETDNSLGQYKVRSKAYFHNEPDESTRRNAFIIHWNNATLTPLEDKDGFVYIVFTNHLGQTSRGWLRKKDLNRVER